MYVALALAFSVGAFLLVDGFMRYQEYQRDLERYRREVTAANKSDATDEQRHQAEGKDESERTGHDLSSYRVEPTEPRILRIQKLGVEARILQMSTNRDGSIQAPVNIYDAGWYVGGAHPGQPGAAIIDGHASGPTRFGLFAYIDKLQPGDGVEIERGDGEVLRYNVTGKREIPLNQIDMSEFMHTEADREVLHLITCGGDWLTGQQTFDKRIVVSTERAF